MKTLIYSLLGAAALAGPGAGLRAADPALPTKGKVLVLDNERTVEGDVERVGDQYRVRRAVGETLVPGDHVLRLCDSLEDAFAFLRGRANLKDPDERLRLANWCHQHGLTEQALAEVKAAVQLRPNHPESRRLLNNLQRAGTAKTPAAEPAPPKGPEPSSTLAVDLTAESLGQFATRVQPILMNTCASCHATGRGGSFRLARAYDVGLLNRKTTEQNLAAVLAQIDFGQPQASRLLTKAVSDHAKMGQAPLKGRQAPAFRALEDWVKLTLANNPQLASEHASTAPVVQLTPEEKGVSPPVMPKAEAMKGPAERTPFAEKGVPLPPIGSTPADPYDPAIFNRQMHPQKSGKSEPPAAPKSGS
jgi:hypothetical protein